MILKKERLVIIEINLVIKAMEEILKSIDMGVYSFFIWPAYIIPLMLIFFFNNYKKRRKLKNIKKYDREI